MPASYPTTVKTFTTKADTTDVNYAAHINDLQEEVVAIQNTLGTAPQGGEASVKNRIAALETGKSSTSHNHDHNALTNLTVGDPHTQYLLKSLGTAKGMMIVYTASGVPVGLAVGTDGQSLVADSAQAAGVRWATSAGITTASFTAKGQILVATGASAFTALAVGANNRILTADSGQASGVRWSTSAPLLEGDFTAKGQLIAATGSGARAALTVGANKAMLLADSAETTGLRWGSNPELAGYSETIVANGAATGAIALTPANSNFFDLTLTGNVTLSITTTGMTTGKGYSITVWTQQDATGGRTVTFWSGIKWTNATVPTPDTSANKINVWTFVTKDAGASWVGALSIRGAS